MSDKKKYKRSKEEIAKEFDLPERKSKIATIMKQDGQAYCLCRTSDCSRFMIGCDGCEEWYHGDCINVSEKEAKHIKHYYCQKCKEEDPTLQTIFRPIPIQGPTANSNISIPSNITTGQPPNSYLKHIEPPSPAAIAAAAALVQKNDESSLLFRKQQAVAAAQEIKIKKKEKKLGSSTYRCGTCDGCRTPKCGKCKACISRNLGRKQRCEKRICVQQKPVKTVGRPRHRKRSVSPDALINPELEGIRQCFGPACRMTARPQSKYCSDDCGMKLATSRIYQVLPQRIQEWNLSPCLAEEQNKRMLDNIRARQAVVRATLAELDKRHKELDLLVERAKRCTLDVKALENNDPEDEMSMYCITCGHEIHSKTAIRHMEKCFNKYESQASFGSVFKTRIEGNAMFCDFYNPASKTYCKRLRVLCPEHCKDAKVSESDVCGSPLVRNVFQLTGEFCRAPKKSCYRHYVWEKIRRAEIDLERVRQWIKMDELIEQERSVKTAMASRAGVLGLMLHSTYNHEVMEKLCSQSVTGR